jgi:two-component system response regulator YesN
MTRFLIADDEPQIRRGLRGLVTQIMEGNAEFIEAEDGIEAYDKAVAEAPDILLLDIHMPRLRGLDLVEKLGGLGRDWIVIVVTGHDEFEYARTALSLRVFDFLLKPVPEEQFRSVVARARKELDKRREERRFVDWSKDRLVQQRGVFRETLLQDWIEGRLSLADFERSAVYLELKLPARPSLLLLAFTDRVPGSPGDWLSAERNRFFTAARQTVLAFPGSLAFEDTRHNVVLIVDRDASGGWKAMADLLEETLQDSLGSPPPIEGLDRETAAALPEAWTVLVGLLASDRAEGGLVQGARTYLEAHYRDPDLSLESVADHLRVTPNYLSRLLKGSTGRSFVNFLCHLRMDKAKVFLEDPRLRIAEVAERVGYRDQNYFCRHFKTVTGRTPKAWRTGQDRDGEP